MILTVYYVDCFWSITVSDPLAPVDDYIKLLRNIEHVLTTRIIKIFLSDNVHSASAMELERITVIV